MELNNITNTGTWGQQATRLNDNFNKVALGIDTLQEMYESISQSAIEVVDTLPQTGEANKIYRLVGTTSYTDYMYNADDLTTPIPMATYNNAIDDVPTAESENLVKSDGINKSISLASSNNEELIHTVEFPFKNNGFWYLSSGVPVKATSPNSYYTDPIAFVDGCSLSLYAAFNSSIALVYMVYNSNDELIASQVTTNNGGAVTGYALNAPSNAAYIICCSQTNIEGIHCKITKNGNIDVVKFNKSDVVNNLTGSIADVEKVAAYPQAIYMSNLWGYVWKGKFLDTSGRAINFPAPRFDRFCISAWIPINAATSTRRLYNLVSNTRNGVVGLAFYSNMGENYFIGYYAPPEDDGTLQENFQFDINLDDAINSNSSFAAAKYVRFTTFPLDIGNQNKNAILEISHIISKVTKNAILLNNGNINKNASYTWDVTDFIILDDVMKNAVIYGASSYARAGVYAVAFYDINKNVIGTAYKDPNDNASTSAEILCKIDVNSMVASYPNASYMRICYNTKYGILSLTNKDEQIKSQSNNYDDRWVLNQFNKIICIGDSVTQGFVADYPTYAVELNYSYPKQLSKLICGDVTNAGRSGDSPVDWMYGRQTPDVRQPLYPNYDFGEYDLVIIEFGYNGDYNSYNVSNINTEGTCAYAYDQLLQGIKGQNSKIEIVLMIPSNGLIMRNRVTVISLIDYLSNTYNCNIIDLREDLFIHLDNAKWHGEYNDSGTMKTDMVHFTRKGYNAKSALIYRKLIEIYK